MGRGATKQPARAAGRTSLHLRIDFGGERSIGPGKVRLLELINETGSISAAGRALAMSYRQAWLLVDELNQMCRAPAIVAQTGGGGGGGAVLTETGNDIVRLYREMERKAYAAATPEVRALARLLRAPDGTAERPLPLRTTTPSRA
jgi:molybdate transport system regulatory protein